MKANEAPEKIYIHVRANKELGTTWHGTRIGVHDIEYIRTNTLEVKEVKEEPVSNNLEEAATKYARKQLSNPDYPTYNDEYEMECAFEAGAQWQKEHTIYKAFNYLFSHMGLFATYFNDNIVENIERSEFIKKFRIAMEE